jgi:hypothetical protein
MLYYVIILNTLLIINCLSQNKGYLFLANSLVTIIFVLLFFRTNKITQDNMKFTLLTPLILNIITLLRIFYIFIRYITLDLTLAALLTLASLATITPIVNFIFIYRVYRIIKRDEE